jgi:hypothetical protein
MSPRIPLLAVGVPMLLFGVGAGFGRAPKPIVPLQGYEFTGGRPVDAFAAMDSPGVYGWKLFLNINRPGTSVYSGHRGYPAPGKKLGDPGPTIFQSWKGIGEVFLPNGADPGSFDSPPPTGVNASASHSSLMMALAAQGLSPGEVTRLALHPGPQTANPALAAALKQLQAHGTDASLETMAMNRAAFDFVHANVLYSRAGQGTYYESHQTLSFPRGAMEIKAMWKDIGPALPKNTQLARFHYFVQNGEAFGLDGLHIITKDVPQWFWCTFEQVDNAPPLYPYQYMPDIDPANNDEFTRTADSPYPVPKMILGNKWKYYRLRGTATSYNFPTGEPNELDNSVIEEPAAYPSSCMSCHARSRADGNGPLAFDLGLVFKSNPPSGPVGPPPPSLFQNSDGVKYLQLDFAWSLSNAQ